MVRWGVRRERAHRGVRDSVSGMAADPAREDVLFVLVRTGSPDIYGGERSTIITAEALKSRGVRCRFLLTADDALRTELDARGIPCDVIPVEDPLVGMRSGGIRGALERVQRIFRVNLAVWRRVRQSKTVVVHAAAVPGVLVSWFGAKASGARHIYHVRDTNASRRTSWHETLSILLADRTLAISDSLRTCLIETAAPRVQSALAARITTLYNGFDLSEMDAAAARHPRAVARASLGLDAQRPMGLLVGGISLKKGQLRFIEEVLPKVVAQVPDFRMVFVGGEREAGYARACAAAVARLGLTAHATFAGYLQLRDVYPWYCAADVAVVASEREGLSRFAVEAHFFGLPVVTLDIPGPVDVVENGTTGFVVPQDRPAEMVEPIVRLLKDGALRQRMAEAARNRVREAFSVDAHVARLLEIYGSLHPRFVAAA